jgi:hypothetical protein
MLLDSRSQEFVNWLCEPVRLIAHDEGVAVGDELYAVARNKGSQPFAVSGR